ncbi:MAG: hypothetical protein ABI658_21685 [Acidimicrobiales bacterium]
MIDISNARLTLRVLEGWLTANDFRQNFSQRKQVTSDDYTEWVTTALCIEIKVDGGQIFLGIGLRAMANTFHPDEWEAWSEGVPLPLQLSDLGHQVDFITRYWLRAAERAGADVTAAERALEAIGLDWLERRFGWRPGETISVVQGGAGSRR